MNVTPRMKATALAGTVAIALSMAACSSDEAGEGGAASGTGASQSADASSAPGSAASSSQPETSMPAAADAGPHNDADVAFTREMIAHHQQAVAMVGLIDGRTDNRQIIDLGERISDAQGPEIEQMSARLAAWGEDPTGATATGPQGEDAGHGDHAGHGGSAMEGMLSDADMQSLAGATGAEFDRLFLQGMIAHHEGAVSMAEAVIRDGENEATRTLAESVIASQQKEIDEMRTLLGEI